MLFKYDAAEAIGNQADDRLGLDFPRFGERRRASTMSFNPPAELKLIPFPYLREFTWAARFNYELQFPSGIGKGKGKGISFDS